MSTRSADLYLRISEDPTGKQAGVERQETDCRALAERLGFEVRRVLVDNDISATTGAPRPAFEELLAGNPPAIIVWHTDRLVRLTADLERVIDLGVNVHAVTAGHLDLSTPAGRAVARTVTAWATYEGEQKAERQKAAARQRASQGRAWWSSRPFGLELDGTLRESEAVYIRKAYEDVLAGVPLQRIAADWNAAGHLTTRGNGWRSVTLRPVLLNPRNAGIRTYDGEEVGPGGWQAIVPEDTYRAAKRLLESPERRVGGGGRRVALLTGFARCGRCGSPCRRTLRGRKHAEGQYPVYQCMGGGCVSYRTAFVDEVVSREVILRLTDPDAAPLWHDDGGTDVEELRASVVSIRERLTALADDYADGLIDRGQLLSATERLRARLRDAEEQLSHSDGGAVLGALVGAQDVERAYLSLSPERQRAVIEALADRVVIMGRKKGTRVMSVDDVVVQWKGTTQEGPQLSA